MPQLSVRRYVPLDSKHAIEGDHRHNHGQVAAREALMLTCLVARIQMRW